MDTRFSRINYPKYKRKSGITNKPTAQFNSSNRWSYLYSIYNSIPVLQKTHYIIKTDNGA